MFNKAIGARARGKARPLPLAKPVRHARSIFGRVIYHYRKQKRMILCHVQYPADRQIPFATEVAFRARIGI